MSEPTLHDGEAFAYVIEGEISVQLVTSPEPTVLRAGDSVYLNTTEHRTYRNVGPGRAILLGVLLRDKKNAVAPGVS